MTRKQERDLWVLAIQTSNNDTSMAMAQFYPLSHYAKPSLNMGLLADRLGDIHLAISWYQHALGIDAYLTAGYFQLGFSWFILKNDREALNCFFKALDTLRGNDVVDYTQIGMEYRLYACEILYNAAICLDELGLGEKAQETLDRASKLCHTKEHERVILGLKQGGFQSLKEILLFRVPKEKLFEYPCNTCPPSPPPTLEREIKRTPVDHSLANVYSMVPPTQKSPIQTEEWVRSMDGLNLQEATRKHEKPLAVMALSMLRPRTSSLKSRKPDSFKTL